MEKINYKKEIKRLTILLEEAFAIVQLLKSRIEIKELVITKSIKVKSDVIKTFKFSGIELKSARKKLGLTQKELGDRLGINAGYICQLEKGRNKNPSYEIVQKLSTIYEQG